jgi:hypothetical protein
VTINYYGRKHSNLAAFRRLVITEISIYFLNTQIRGRGKNGIERSAVVVQRRRSVLIGQLDFSVEAGIQIQHVAFSKIGPPDYRSVLSFFGPFFPTFVSEAGFA